MSEKNLADDMRETALEALNAQRESGEIEEDESPEEPEEQAEQPEQEAVEDTEQEASAETDTEEVEEIEASSEDDATEGEAEEPTPEPEDDLDPRLVNPPTTWRAQAKAKWADIPADIREEIRKREDDAMNGLNQYKEKAEFGERLDRTIHPYQPILQQRGLTAEQAVSESLQFIHTMTTATPEQKGAILHNLAQMYGADMNVAQDENALKLQQQLRPLYDELNRLRQDSQQQVTQQQQTLENEINAFASATDENGVLSHPYFEKVRGLMASIIESGQAKGLDDAYQIAIKAHPDTSGLIESEQTARKEAERQEQAKKRAAKAKKNDDVNISKKGHHEGQSKPVGTLRDTAKEALAEIRARA